MRAQPGGRHRLPTIRELATALRVSPVTVAAAYRMLRARGLVVAGGRRGTHVRGHHSIEGPGRRGDHDATHLSDGAVDLASGNPDPELLPALEPHLHRLGRTRHLYGEPQAFRPLVAFAQAEFEARRRSRPAT